MDLVASTAVSYAVPCEVLVAKCLFTVLGLGFPVRKTECNELIKKHGKDDMKWEVCTCSYPQGGILRVYLHR